METNTCDVNQLDADALLPPRKRLLAGLKRQNSDLNSPSPSFSNAGNEYDIRLNNLLKARLSNPNLSNEEIVESSRFAAIEAAKVAEAARANAEEKAAKAAKAVAAAKTALDLVATLSEEMAASKEKFLKRNKMKKHVNVQALYNKNKLSTNSRTDEELARNLHRVMNSSPRISRNSGGDDMKTHKHKRLKSSAPKISHLNGFSEFNGNGEVGEVEIEGSVKEVDMIMVDLNTSKGDELMFVNGEGSRSSKTDPLRLENGEVETFLSNERHGESLDSLSKKRGRMKQKKLPLSICSYRDKTSPKEERKSRGTTNVEENTSKISIGGPSGNNLMPVEKTNLWKCQAFKAPACMKQNKVMQS